MANAGESRHPLDAIFNPRSVAVVGASNALHRAGGRRFGSLIRGGFAGPIHPVHPTAAEVQGLKAWPSLRNVPGPVDFVVVMVRPDLVEGVIDDCVAMQVRGVLVLTAGFGETGEAGRVLETTLARKLRAAGGRMVGPNCAGLYSGSGQVNVLGWRTVPRGPIALVTQSGNMAHTFAQKARTHGVGFSKIVSIGNAADLKPADYVDYLCTDPETKVILLYVEGFGPDEGRDFCERVRDHPGRKPVVVLKPGATESGRRAALSHTGSLAGEDRVVDAAFRQCGILRAADSDEAWAGAMALATLPPMQRASVVVISDGGGHATVVSEAAARAGLETPALSAQTQAALAALLPARSTMHNPVDFSGRAEEAPEVVPQVVATCLADDGVGGVILAGHFGGYFKDRTEEIRQQEEAAGAALADAVAKHGKPFVLHTVYGIERLPALEPLRKAGGAIFDSLEVSSRALGMVWRESQRAAMPRPASPPTQAFDRDKVDALLAKAQGDPPWLAEPEARELLTAFSVAVPRFAVAKSGAQAHAAAEKFGCAVALKLISADLVHKSDAGGVILDIEGGGAADLACSTLLEIAAGMQARNPRVLVTPMITDGVEVVVGGFRDPQFGPVVMCGLGGIFVEALDDVVFRMAPMDTEQAAQMISSLRAASVLRGLRGRAPVDVASLATLIARVSMMLVALPRIAELDLNPVFVRRAGVAIADARVVLR